MKRHIACVLGITAWDYRIVVDTAARIVTVLKIGHRKDIDR
jgi:mRNA-degrading endonuclease RelE of RelBE toxin-antitoxin system